MSVMFAGAACAGKARPHTIYELGGSEVLSLSQMFERALRWSGRRRLFLNVPFWLAQLTTLVGCAAARKLASFQRLEAAIDLLKFSTRGIHKRMNYNGTKP